MYPLVRSLSVELSPPEGDDAETRRVCRPLFDQSLGNPVLLLLEKVFRRHKRPVGMRWRMDETCNGQIRLRNVNLTEKGIEGFGQVP